MNKQKIKTIRNSNKTGRHFEYRMKKELKKKKKTKEKEKWAVKQWRNVETEKKMLIVSEMRSFVFQYDSPEQWIVFVVAFFELSMESKEAAQPKRKEGDGTKKNVKNRINIGIRHDIIFFNDRPRTNHKGT